MFRNRKEDEEKGEEVKKIRKEKNEEKGKKVLI